MQDFKKLRVWSLAHELALDVIEALPPRIARRVPGLRNQAIRAATSVAANIAEGCGSATRPEFLQCVEIATASLNELEGELILAHDTRVITDASHKRLQARLEMVRRMLIALMRTLQRHIAEDTQRQKCRRSSPDGDPSEAPIVEPAPTEHSTR